MKSWKKWWTLYLGQRWDKRVLVGAAALALIPIAASLIGRGGPPKTAGGGAAFAVDTHIPRGFVLIPIEADNYEALDSILGRFGWVDLFQAGSEGGERKLVARNVRLLRAPHDPSHFAVLVPERDSTRILKAGGVFTVVIRRPGTAGMEIVNQPARRAEPARRRITYEGE